MAIAERRRSASRSRRLVEITAFVAVWMAIGLFVFDAPDHINTYLLLGVPLTAAFQLFVRREDIRELWVRGSPPIRSRRLAALIAAALSAYLVAQLVEAISRAEPVSQFLYIAAGLVGAGAAGYAFDRFTRVTWRDLLLCVALVGAYTALLYAIFDDVEVVSGRLVFKADPDLLAFLTALLTYMPVAFVLEEVVFRGLLDSHLHHPGDRHRLLSAAYVSMLWITWHSPIFGLDVFLTGTLLMLPIGIVLSLLWRRSGNLGVTTTGHALSDSIRNAVVGPP